MRAFSLNKDEMRLGKSMESLVASILRGAEKTLIIPPGSARNSWGEEVERWARDKALILYGRAGDLARWHGSRKLIHGREACREAIALARWVVCNYDLLIPQSARDGAGGVYIREDLPGWTTTLMDFVFDEAILDEIHRFRGWRESRKLEENKRQILTRLIDPIRVVSALTGTPISARARDFYVPWQLISKTVGETPFRYQARYSAARHVEFEIQHPTGERSMIRRWDESGRSNEAELVARQKWFVIGRAQAEVLDQLPEIQYKIERVEADKNLKIPGRGDAKSRIGKLMESTARIKIPRLLEIAGDEFDEGRKIVVTTFLKSSCDLVAKSLSKLVKKTKLKIINANGVTVDRRHKIAKEFRDHEGPAAYVTTIDAGEVNTNLVGAKLLIYFEIHHLPASNRQVGFRPRLPGVVSLTYLFLAVRDSIDEIRALDMVPKLETLELLSGDKEAPEMRAKMEELSCPLSEEEQIARLTAHLTGEEEIDDV